MRSVTVTQAKVELDALIDAAAAGEDVRIETEGGPAIRLVVVPKAEPATEGEPKRRKLGYLKGQVWVSDNFDDPLPDDILNAFYGEEK